MLDDERIRVDCERVARDILSRKFWPFLDVALFLGYSRNNIDLIADKRRFYIYRLGGKKHLYAIDVLALFEEQSGMEFPDLAAKWYDIFKINPPHTK